jgi:hypothetical protein
MIRSRAGIVRWARYASASTEEVSLQWRSSVLEPVVEDTTFTVRLANASDPSVRDLGATYKAVSPSR